MDLRSPLVWSQFAIPPFYVPHSVVVENCTAEDAFDGTLSRGESPSGDLQSIVIFSHDSVP